MYLNIDCAAMYVNVSKITTNVISHRNLFLSPSERGARDCPFARGLINSGLMACCNRSYILPIPTPTQKCSTQMIATWNPMEKTCFTPPPDPNAWLWQPVVLSVAPGILFSLLSIFIVDDVVCEQFTRHAAELASVSVAPIVLCFLHSESMSSGDCWIPPLDILFSAAVRIHRCRPDA